MSIRWLSRKMRAARSNQRGITLVEMCITIVILAMITGALSAAFVTSINSASNSATRVNQTNDAQIIAGFLTRDAQATGGTDPSTGLADGTLGVSPTDNASCAVPGNLVARFKWIDRSDTSIPGTVRVANYSWIQNATGSFKAQQLVRTTCFGTVGSPLTTPSSLTLANLVVSAPTITCNTTCIPVPPATGAFPDTIAMKISESNGAGTAPYTFTLTASVRPQNTLEATPTVPAPLVLLGRTACADNTTGLGFTGLILAAGNTINVSGRAFIDAADAGGCEALSMSNGFLSFNNHVNADELNVLTGGTCSGSVCPASSDINHYSPELLDPYRNLPTPTTSSPVFPATSCNGHASPGVYSGTLTVQGGNSCTLDPGVYVLKGGMSVQTSSELVGNGVLLYIPSTANGGNANATFNANGAARISLTPPTSGTYAGINLWQAQPNTVQLGLTIGGFISNDVNILGTIYAPNTQVRDVASFNGLINLGGIVAQTLVMDTSIVATLNINPLQIALPDSLPQWTIGIPNYPGQVTASGGLAPYSYSLSNGNLPAGLALNATTGAITGTPTAAGTANFTVRVTDGFGHTVLRQFSLVINAAPAIATALPNWTQNINYHDRQLSTGSPVTTGTAPFVWTLDSGTLPPGITLSPSGLISGSPNTTGTFTFRIKVVDGPGASATRDYSVIINPPPTIATPTSLPASWNANTAYQQVTATVTPGTGTGPTFTWSENLPPGLNIGATSGVISGTPSNAGPYPNASITVTDSVGATVTKVFPMVINPQLGFQTGTPNTAEQNVPYTFKVVPAGGQAPFTFTSTGFPVAGVNMVGDTISGTPNTVGTFPISITITDGTGASTAPKNYVFTVVKPVTFSGTLHGWTVGRSFTPTVNLTANDGTGTRTFSAVPGTLPPGMTISSSGSVGGTPTTAGDYNAQITISDSAGGSQTQTLPIKIYPAPVVATDSLPSGERTVPYTSFDLSVQAGTGYPNVTWTASGLSASGLTLTGSTISGTPNAGGTFPVTIRAIDAAGVASAPVTLQLVIAQAPQINSQILPAWTVNVPSYAAQLNPPSGGSGTGYTFSIQSGSLPAGLTMTSDGAISGTPTAAGSSTFTVRITDSLGGFGTQNETIVINAVPVITTPSLPNGAFNALYSATQTTNGGGTPNLTWSETGPLPTGLTFDATTGAIGGTPIQLGTFPISVTVTDALGVASAPQPESITISPFGMSSIVMQDTNGNGKVDQVVVTFNATLVTIPSTTNTTQWAITNAPSGATKKSVSASGNTATLVLNEGNGTADTSVGSFTVALTASATGVRTTGGAQASFPATAPTDNARPVPISVTLNSGSSSGTVNAGDFINITYSENLSAASICAGWSNNVNPSSTTATVSISGTSPEPITFGAPCTNIGVVNTTRDYVDPGTRTYAGSTILWTPSTKTLRITLAGGSGTSTNNNQQSDNATYTPGTSLADLAPVPNTASGALFTDQNNTRF